jgi:hypothetical protein
MRKISQTKSAVDNQCTEDHTDADERPRRIPGATITSWKGSPQIDLEALFDRSRSGPTLAGAAKDAPNRPVDGDTVALPDGSRITFVGSNQFESVLTT